MIQHSVQLQNSPLSKWTWLSFSRPEVTSFLPWLKRETCWMPASLKGLKSWKSFRVSPNRAHVVFRFTCCVSFNIYSEIQWFSHSAFWRYLQYDSAKHKCVMYLSIHDYRPLAKWCPLCVSLHCDKKSFSLQRWQTLTTLLIILSCCLGFTPHKMKLVNETTYMVQNLLSFWTFVMFCV